MKSSCKQTFAENKEKSEKQKSRNYNFRLEDLTNRGKGYMKSRQEILSSMGK